MEGPALKLYFFINWDNSLRSAKLRKIREYTQCSVYQKRNPNGRILKTQWKRTTRSALCITAIISTIFYRIFTIIWWSRIKQRTLFVQRYKWCKSNIHWLLSIFPFDSFVWKSFIWKVATTMHGNQIKVVFLNFAWWLQVCLHLTEIIKVLSIWGFTIVT